MSNSNFQESKLIILCHFLTKAVELPSYETGEHLFLHCEYVRELWSLVFCMFGIQWTMPCTVLNLLACWKRQGLTKDQNIIWNAIPGCLMWLIWRERNQRAFEDIERHTMDLKLSFIRTLMEW